MRIPDTIDRQHILKAISELVGIGEKHIPSRRRSTKYDLLHDGRRFPPKYTICLANKYASQKELPPRFHGGAPTNNFLEARGFKIIHKDGRSWQFETDPEDESQVFDEGEKSYELHLKIERDSRIAKLAKAKRWNEVGRLACDACGFDFHRVYGVRGYRYIEAHHTIPVSELKRGQRTRLDDIALVCSNCHRMLHRSRPWLSIRELANAISVREKRQSR